MGKHFCVANLKNGLKQVRRTTSSTVPSLPIWEKRALLVSARLHLNYNLPGRLSINSCCQLRKIERRLRERICAQNHAFPGR